MSKKSRSALGKRPGHDDDVRPRPRLRLACRPIAPGPRTISLNRDAIAHRSPLANRHSCPAIQRPFAAYPGNGSVASLHLRGTWRLPARREEHVAGYPAPLQGYAVVRAVYFTLDAGVSLGTWTT